MAQSKVKFVKQYGKRWGLSLGGHDKLQYSFDDCSHISAGDVIDYEMVTKGEYTNVVLSGKIPTTDVNNDLNNDQNSVSNAGTVGDLVKGVVMDDRQVSIIAQNLTNRAYDAVISDAKYSKTPIVYEQIKLAVFDAIEAYNLCKKCLTEAPKEWTKKEPF